MKNEQDRKTNEPTPGDRNVPSADAAAMLARLTRGVTFESRAKGTTLWRPIPPDQVVRSLAPIYADLARAFRQMLDGAELEAALADFRVCRRAQG